MKFFDTLPNYTVRLALFVSSGLVVLGLFLRVVFVEEADVDPSAAFASFVLFSIVGSMCFVLSVLVFVFFVVLPKRSLIYHFIKSPKTNTGIDQSTLFLCFIVLGCILYVLLVVSPVSFQWDMSKKKVYGLSQQTKDLLKQVETPMKLCFFTPKQNHGKGYFDHYYLYKRVMHSLRRYAYWNSPIRVQYVPYKKRHQYADIIETHELVALALAPKEVYVLFSKDMLSHKKQMSKGAKEIVPLILHPNKSFHPDYSGLRDIGKEQETEISQLILQLHNQIEEITDPQKSVFSLRTPDHSYRHRPNPPSDPLSRIIFDKVGMFTTFVFPFLVLLVGGLLKIFGKRLFY